MMRMRWPAPAKINLMLHVVGRRDDGYHLLQTWFQFIDRYDWLEFDLTGDGLVSRATELDGVPADQDLVVRAARLLRDYAGDSRLGVRIHVDKQIPMGAGLGGGSSNAATALVALNELWRLDLEPAELVRLGLQLGADVPVFVHARAAWAEGVGELLTPLDAELGPILVLNPGVHVDTGQVFRHPQLTRDTPTIKIPELPRSDTRNDCESVTRALYPAVGDALDWLGELAQARMSGTGASVFACFDKAHDAQAAAAKVPMAWTSWVGRRLNRSPLAYAVAEHRRRHRSG